MVRVTGIGRNEYIATMNKCKAKKLLWRVNKALAKEFLPTEPLVPAAMQPWWLVATVNIGMPLCIGSLVVRASACSHAALGACGHCQPQCAAFCRHVDQE